MEHKGMIVALMVSVMLLGTANSFCGYFCSKLR
jgi:hypothetical protein